MGLRFVTAGHIPSTVRIVMHTIVADKGMHKATASSSNNRGWEMLSLEEALVSLERMPRLPSIRTFTCILQKCRKRKSLAHAQRLHAYIRKSGLESHRTVGNYLVPMLVEVGTMCNAQQVFNSLVDRNEHSWTSLIAGYIECGELQHAINLYQKMKEDRVHPSEFTFVALLKACGRLKDAVRGQEIHAEIARKGLERDIFLGNTLVDMYAKCGLLAKARDVFDKLPVRDVVSWTALIAAYAEDGLGDEALNCFEQMQLEGVCPNAVTFVCSLKACGSIGAIEMGQEIHAEIARKGLERDLVVGNTLVDMYGKCGLLAKAREAFGKLPARDVVSWNALIAGYAKHGLGEEALNCFEHMQLEGISPNAATLVCSLKACGCTGAIDKGQEIHAEIARKGLEGDLVVGNALVDMYAKCGLTAKAREVFDELLIRDVVSWTALITGYAQYGLGEDAISFFEQMQLEGASPDALTFVSSLKACASLGALDKGQRIHVEIARRGWLEKDPSVGNALIDMYAKCGWLAKACELFDELPVRDLVTWNALITGYAYLGESENAFHMLERMRGEIIRPDGVTFLSVLAACSHTGLVEKGQEYFEAMSKDYGLTPSIEHHACMVDLLGRAGQLDKAVMLMRKMPFHPNNVVWHTLLAACRKGGNVEIGRQAFLQTMQLGGMDVAAYVLMSNIYADAHLQENKNDEAIRVNQAWNKPGQWCTDVDEIVHSFSVGDSRHWQRKSAYEELEDFAWKMTEEGYVPDMD